MSFGPSVGNVGMYIAREMLASVPEEDRPRYLKLVEEIAELKYQLGVEVARQLPRLLAEHDTDRVQTYLDQVRSVAALGWKSSVEVAKQLPDLYDAPDPAMATAYVDIITEANSGASDDDEDTSSLVEELAELERQIREMEPKIQRAQEIKSHLAAKDRRDETRRKHAVDLAAALPAVLARLRPKHRPVFLTEVNRVAVADSEAALEAADTLLDLLNGERLSAEGAAEWVKRGLDVLDRNKEVGRGYFRLGSKYALDVVEELHEGLALKEVARVLKLYATALCGRDVAIRSTLETYAIEAFGSDHVVLPPDMRYFEDDEQNFTAYKVATAHGAGRIEFGTYDFRLDDLGDLVGGLTARYGGSS